MEGNQHVKEKLKTNLFQCSVCLDTKKATKYFAKKNLLNSHIKRIHTQRCNECHICFKTFTFPSELKKHQNIHTDTKYKCDVCLKVFSRKHNLQYYLFYGHQQKSRDDDLKPLKCDFCSQEFLLISHLEKHVVDQHVVDKEFECDICSKTFVDQKTMEKHRKDHGTRTKYFCDVCSKRYTDKKSLSIHLEVKHNKFFYCGQCLASFKNKPEFDKHLNTQSSLQQKLELKCQFCKVIMTSQCSLKVHGNSHLKIKIEKGSKALTKQRSEVGQSSQNIQLPLLEIKCEHCLKTFVRRANFATHRKQVHPNAMWTCDFEKCTKSFNKYSKLTSHKRTHSDLKIYKYGTYVCPTCHKSFNLLRKLKFHQKTHLVDKKIKCELCPKTFVSFGARKLHIANKHGGPKQFKCPVPNCGMSFATQGTLTPHLVIHESAKLFKCDICEEPAKEFKSYLSLRQHLRVVHSEANRKKKSLMLLKQVVFTCTSKECSSFKTRSDKEVAMHYNEKHGLPRVVLFQKDVVKVVNTPLRSVLLFTEELPNYDTNRMILKRYKCKFCLKLFSFSLFKKHPEKCFANKAFKCYGCTKTFKYKNSLHKHVQETHCKQQEN